MKMKIKELAQLFNVPMSWVYRQQKKYIINQIETITEKLNIFINHLNNTISDSKDIWFIEDQLEILNDKLNKLERKKAWLNSMITNHKEAEQTNTEYIPRQQDYNIEELKKVPIDRIVKVSPHGFFKIRNEKTPSVKWYKDDNRYYDFGASTGGDNVSLVMELHNYSFREALEYLSGF